MKLFSKILSFVLGAVFMFSGFIKLVDPEGTAIKLEEYFTAFSSISVYYQLGFVGSLFEWLSEYTMLLSIGLSTLEIVLGLALILSYKPKLITSVTFGLLAFFGLLTGYSANCDPANVYGVSCVTDCGCFGDFLPLQPIQSFYKDLILSAICFPLVIQSFKAGTISNDKKSHSIGILGLTITCILFGVYTINNLPILDFRPYKIGNNIIELRKNGQPAEIAYVMSKNGEEKTFKTYPYDQGYTFVKTETVNDAISPTAKDFYLYDENGNDISEDILKKHTVFIVSKEISNISDTDVLHLNKIIKHNNQSNIEVATLTSSILEDFEKKSIQTDKLNGFYNLDQTVIKAIIRTNPGIIEINNGIVINKWTLDDYFKTIE